MAAAGTGFDVTAGGKVVEFLQRDEFYYNRVLYAGSMAGNLDLYDGALSDWAANARSVLAGKVPPSTLALIAAADAARRGELSPEDYGGDDEINVARMAADQIAVVGALVEAKDKLYLLANDLEQQMLGDGVTAETFLLLEEQKAAALDHHEMAQEARDAMTQRARGVLYVIGHPTTVIDHYEAEFARADAVETQARAEIISMVMGAAGLTKVTLGKLGKMGAKIATKAEKLETAAGAGTDIVPDASPTKVAEAATDGPAAGPESGSATSPTSAEELPTPPPVHQITLNRQNGIEFERKVVEALAHVGGGGQRTPHL